MKFCSKCGNQLNDNAKFCPACGAAVPQPEASAEPEPKMIFCTNCGARIPETARVCPQCGAGCEEGIPPAETAAVGTPKGENAFLKFFKKLDDTEDSSDKMSQDDIEKNKAMSILAYLGVLVLVPAFAAGKSQFARYHVKRALSVFVMNLAWDGLLFSMAIPWLDHAMWSGQAMFAMAGWYFITLVVLSVLGKILFLALTISGIVHAAGGKAKELPVLEKLHLFP